MVSQFHFASANFKLQCCVTLLFQCVNGVSVVHRDLFNAAFLSCWSELSEDQQDELIRSIELALTSQDIAEVTQTLLNLAEFMEHSDKVSIEHQELLPQKHCVWTQPVHMLCFIRVLLALYLQLHFLNSR